MFSLTDQSPLFQYTRRPVCSYKSRLLLQQEPALSLGLKSYLAKLCTTEQRQPLLQGAYEPASTPCLNFLRRNLRGGPLPHLDTPSYTGEPRIPGLNPRGAPPGHASDLTLSQRSPNCPRPQSEGQAQHSLGDHQTT